MKVTFLKSAYLEVHYPPPDRPEVAFVGKSNVGKSSLINVLVNRKKIARISSSPGRTQAINFFVADSRLYLVDLPGYGYARVPLRVKKSWGNMVEAYLKNRSNLKAVILILDIRREPGPDEINLLRWLNQHRLHTIPVLTKTDKLSRQRSLSRAKAVGHSLDGIIVDGPILFSAKTKEGREKIWEKIEEAIEV